MQRFKVVHACLLCQLSFDGTCLGKEELIQIIFLYSTLCGGALGEENRHEIKLLPMCAQYEIPDSWKVSSGDRNGALSLVERWRKPTNESFAQPRGEGPKAGERSSIYMIPIF